MNERNHNNFLNLFKLIHNLTKLSKMIMSFHVVWYSFHAEHNLITKFCLKIGIKYILLTLGWIWENLSSTPLTPKSGEVELHIAPKDAVAAIASIASAQLGI